MRLAVTLAVWLMAISPAAAQKITVKSATPNNGEQGALDLDVVIAGNGFGQGAKAEFFLSGTQNPDGIRVKSTRFVSSSQVVATIDIDEAASLSFFDVKVSLNGRSGKGTDLFQVIQKVSGRPRLCPPPATNPAFQIVETLAATTATGALGISMSAGRSTVGSAASVREVLVVGAGTSNENSSSGSLEIFFVDPATGARLDGTSLLPGSPVQPHLSYAMPTGTAAGQQAAGDINGDGLTDFVVTTHNGVSNRATLFLGQQTGTGVVSYQAIPVPNPSDYMRFGYGVATGDVTGDGIDEFIVADGYACCSKSRKPSLYIYGVSGASPVLLQRVVPTNGTVAALASYGSSLAVADVSGDGFNDLVVSNDAWGDSRLSNSGAVMVHHGTGTGPAWISPTAVVLQEASPARDRNFGAAVAVGDFGLSGVAFDVIGIVKSSPLGEFYRGPLLASGQTPDVTVRLNAIPGWTRGWWTRPPAVADLNGDGLKDVAFGAPHAPDDLTCDPLGAAHVFMARGTPATGVTGWDVFLLTAPDAAPVVFGWSVAAARGSRLLFVAEKKRDVAGVTGAGRIVVYRMVP